MFACLLDTLINYSSVHPQQTYIWKTQRAKYLFPTGPTPVLYFTELKIKELSSFCPGKTAVTKAAEHVLVYAAEKKKLKKCKEDKM